MVGQNLGELSAAAWRLWRGRLEINVSCWVLSSLRCTLPAPSPVQMVLAFWLWAAKRGHTHRHTHTYTYSETDKETCCPTGHAPFEDLWAGLPAGNSSPSTEGHIGLLSSSLALARTRSAQVYPKARPPTRVWSSLWPHKCLQVSPVSSLSGHTGKGCFGKGTKSGWAVTCTKASQIKS